VKNARLAFEVAGLAGKEKGICRIVRKKMNPNYGGQRVREKTKERGDKISSLWPDQKVDRTSIGGRDLAQEAMGARGSCARKGSGGRYPVVEREQVTP